jgi:hypothetical protein
LRRYSASPTLRSQPLDKQRLLVSPLERTPSALWARAGTRTRYAPASKRLIKKGLEPIFPNTRPSPLVYGSFYSTRGQKSTPILADVGLRQCSYDEVHTLRPDKRILPGGVSRRPGDLSRSLPAFFAFRLASIASYTRTILLRRVVLLCLYVAVLRRQHPPRSTPRGSEPLQLALSDSPACPPPKRSV